MDALKLEVDKRDAEIKNLQRNLKDAETIMVSDCDMVENREKWRKLVARSSVVPQRPGG